MKDNIITKLKDRLLRFTILMRKRQMFYLELIESRSGDWYKMKFPTKKYQNMTHREWFSNIGIKLDQVTRGYYYDGVMMLYGGLDHKAFVLNKKTRAKILDAYSQLQAKGYEVKKIGIGGINSRWRTLIGKQWKAEYYIDMFLFPTTIKKENKYE